MAIFHIFYGILQEQWMKVLIHSLMTSTL